MAAIKQLHGIFILLKNYKNFIININCKKAKRGIKPKEHFDFCSNIH